MVHVLIIEDEIKLATALRDGLQANGYETTVAHCGRTAIQNICETTVDLILLDLILPGLSGLEILRELRRIGLRTPVLIISSKSFFNDRIIGLQAGADDYLTKPFEFPELLARMRALCRRVNSGLSSVLELAGLKMDLQTHSTVRDGLPLDLTAREFELLECLLSNTGAVVSREMIARSIWKSPYHLPTLDNVIDVHIARIRRKLDDPFSVKLLHTVRGVGYILSSNQDT